MKTFRSPRFVNVKTRGGNDQTNHCFNIDKMLLVLNELISRAKASK